MALEKNRIKVEPRPRKLLRNTDDLRKRTNDYLKGKQQQKQLPVPVVPTASMHNHLQLPPLMTKTSVSRLQHKLLFTKDAKDKTQRKTYESSAGSPTITTSTGR